MKRAHTLIFMLFFLLRLPMSGETVFRHWEESGGLPSDQVRAITMLDDGRLIYRTPNSLVTYGEEGFRLYKTERSQLYPLRFGMKNVHVLYPDADGGVWVKSPGSLARFNTLTNSYEYNVDSLMARKYGVETRLADFFIDKGRDVWMLTLDDRLLWHDSRSGVTQEVTRVDGPWKSRNGAIVEITGDAAEGIAVTDRLAMLVYDKGEGKFVRTDTSIEGVQTDTDKKTRIIGDEGGDLWLMHGHTLWHRPSGGEWREFLKLEGPTNFFTSMTRSASGDIWVGSSWSGLRIINGKTHEVRHIPGIPVEKGGMLTNDIQDLYGDPHGGVWAGLLWQGLAYHHPDMHPFVTVHTAPVPSLHTNESVRAFLPSGDGKVLMATSFEGIVEYDPATGETAPYRRDLFPKDDVYMCLMRDSGGDLWVGTYEHGFIRVHKDGGVSRYNYDPGRQTNIGRFVYEDENGRFWVAVNDAGVGELNPETGKVEMLSDRHKRLAFHRRDLGIAPYGNGELCIYGDEGVYIYNPVTDRAYISRLDEQGGRQYFSSCNGMLTDMRGLRWFATDEGIVVRVPDSGEAQGYRDILLNAAETELPSDYVSNIVEDRTGDIWATTSGGLVRISCRQEEGEPRFTIKAYGYANGWECGRPSENSASLFPDGSIYIGGYNGAVHFSPEKLPEGIESARFPVFAALPAMAVRTSREEEVRDSWWGFMLVVMLMCLAGAVGAGFYFGRKTQVPVPLVADTPREEWANDDVAGNPKVSKEEEQMLKRASEIVEKRLGEPDFTPQELGAELGMSRSGLYRKFGAASGMSPADYILGKRLERGAHLLKSTSLTVEEIAGRCGFNSTKYFTRHFKEKYGKTPGVFRVER